MTREPHREVEAGESKMAMADPRFPRLLQLLRAKCKDVGPAGLIASEILLRSSEPDTLSIL